MSSSLDKPTGLRWWLLIAMLALTALVASRFANVEQLIGALRHGALAWVLVALALHLVYFWLYAGLYQVGFRTVGVESRMWDLVPLVFVSLFINALVPTGGVGGAAVFIDDAVQRGQSGARAAVGVVWVFVADLISLVPFILYGSVFLYQHGELKFYDTLGGGIFLIFIAVVCLLMILALWQKQVLSQLLSLVQRLANRIGGWFRHPGWLAGDWSQRTAKELVEAVSAILATPGWMTYTLLVGLFLHVLNLVGLYALFVAFRQPVQLGTLVSGFGMGIVFYVITIIPQGVGAVEGIMTLVFNSMGIPKANALVITLCFRGLNFWLPILFGFLSIRGLSRFKGAVGQVETPEQDTTEVECTN